MWGYLTTGWSPYLGTTQTPPFRCAPRTLTPPVDVLILFSMAVQTLGEAWKLGWGVRARCLWGGPDPHSRHNRISIECDTTVRLDMETLVWTRGSKFPLDQLSSRLKCPKCGERRVQVYFEVPGEPKARTVRAAECPLKAPRCTTFPQAIKGKVGNDVGNVWEIPVSIHLE
jgi:hypothetical protein